MSLVTLSFDLDFDFGDLKRWLMENGLLQVAIGDYTREQIVAMVQFILAETSVRAVGEAPAPPQSLTPFPENVSGMDEVPF